ncbi:glutaredoxin-C1-like [Mangifera indica]|uniref:glutaredoxin-C1-like n=1 Tax=Mangifera indica TaxID=29780 RepID=UPI001CFA48C5|nr:glutaredoxin-C1-like [Mangifera indica]
MVTSFPVVMFGKTYCGYCRRAKELLTQLGAIYNVIELDEESNGEEIQSALAQWTGQRTAPNVFIGGNNLLFRGIKKVSLPLQISSAENF